MSHIELVKNIFLSKRAFGALSRLCGKRGKSLCVVFFILSFLCLSAKASNIQITSVALKNKDVANGTIYINFDLSWDYSWKERVHANWDAAWVFAKCYDDYLDEWKQVYLTPPAGNPVLNPSGSYIAEPHHIGGANVPMWSEFATSPTELGEKTVGLFIYRKGVGHGSNNITDISLQWNYRDQDFLDEDTLQISVFAIEMVYIPAHTYIIGDGVSEQSLYLDGNNLIIKTDVAQKQSKYMGTVTTEKGLSYNGVAIPDTFPKGVKAFYLMKYEITQHGYVDFLNTLTTEQQTTRTSIAPTSARGTLAMPSGTYRTNATQYRNFIRVRNPAMPAQDNIPARSAIYGHSVTGQDDEEGWDMETNGGNIACNFLSWNDGLAYLDWSCLRPMTELEYEKACRGTKFLRKEMAWGQQYGYSCNAKGIANANQPDERPVDTTTCYLETGKAPWVIRVGAFARDSTYRNQSGATYYGVMEMSGNLWERCVNVATDAGRAFIPVNGDGKLSQEGEAEVISSQGTVCWPEEAGGGLRGAAQVSNRKNATYSGSGGRYPAWGFRGCRYAPAGTKFEL